MKKYLITNEGTFYKANLHCHTTCSDGRLSPEEVKRIYKERGYSVIAYTDHDILLDRKHLCDEEFIALNGLEIEVNEQKDLPFSQLKTCHMCFIALTPDNLTQFCYHREWYLFGNAPKYRDQLKFDENAPDYIRRYSHEGISEIMKTGRDNGFFVTYNHPCWSTESQREYSGYNHMHAMEICNNSCIVGGFEDYNEKEYDDMLRANKRIYCIATDDNHNAHPTDSPRCDSFGGFTMIKAPALTYTDITNALVNGNFYASQAPEIYDLYCENGEVHITCSPASKIVLNTAIRKTQIAFPEGDKPLTKAVFKLEKDFVFFRITVTDKDGKHANTNAYFMDEILKD